MEAILRESDLTFVEARELALAEFDREYLAAALRRHGGTSRRPRGPSVCIARVCRNCSRADICGFRQPRMMTSSDHAVHMRGHVVNVP